MATPVRFHLLAAIVAVCCWVLAGCVLAEIHATVSPVPPWFTFDAKGLDDRQPTVIVATHATEPAATAPAGGPVAPPGQ